MSPGSMTDTAIGKAPCTSLRLFYGSTVVLIGFTLLHFHGHFLVSYTRFIGLLEKDILRDFMNLRVPKQNNRDRVDTIPEHRHFYQKRDARVPPMTMLSSSGVSTFTRGEAR